MQTELTNIWGKYIREAVMTFCIMTLINIGMMQFLK